MEKLVKVKELERELEVEKGKARSAWSKGVYDYCFDFINTLKDEGVEVIGLEELEKKLLNGARNWDDYSWGGSSLIYNGDIAKRLCTPSEFRRKREGELKPNKAEEWLDVQARALYQAYFRIRLTIKNILRQ